MKPAQSAKRTVTMIKLTPAFAAAVAEACAKTGALLIADEVIIDKVDGPGIAGLEHGIQLCQHLGGRFQAGIAPVERRNVAKFAAIGASTRKLHVCQEIAGEIEQVVRRQRKFLEG